MEVFVLIIKIICALFWGAAACICEIKYKDTRNIDFLVFMFFSLTIFHLFLFSIFLP